jgi:FADH2 O2-dependent halogenase
VKIEADVAVAGSGFAGSLVALIARRLGLSVALLERGSHPRFAIGESSSPLANLLLESVCERYGLDRVRALAKWGTWRAARPEIGCGLKRGFTFYAHAPGRPFAGDAQRTDQLLVAASPRDEIADTHWYRPDFDHFLVEEARSAGAAYVDRLVIDRVEVGGRGARLDGLRGTEPVCVRARLLVDATGPRGLLARALELEDAGFAGFPRTAGLYTHSSGVRRLEAMGVGLVGPETPPYPPDDAAVHHVFPGGWIWVLRFADGTTSAGVAATEELASELVFSDGEPGWQRLLARLPTVGEQFSESRPLFPFVYHPRLAWRARVASGPGWTMLPSAAAFVDPLLSTGFPLTLSGVERLALRLEGDWESPQWTDRLAQDARLALAEADRAALLIAALYRSFADFPLFASLTKLYFASASFTEAARRLGRPGLAGSFLCGGHPRFGPALVDCCREVLDASAADRSDPGWRRARMAQIGNAIEPIDVAGLTDSSRRNWFPVLASDLVGAAGKLEATAPEIELLLERTGFARPASPASR